MRRHLLRLVGVLAIGVGLMSMTAQLVGGASSVSAAPPSFVFSTGSPTGLMAMLSGNTNGGPRTEAGDDFAVAKEVHLKSMRLLQRAPLGIDASYIFLRERVRLSCHYSLQQL